MNWSKIKNIMIVILVLINLFLILNLAFFRYRSQTLPEGVAESFENILSKHGITIDERVVPSLYELRTAVTASAFDIDRLTEIFIGERVQYVSEGGSLVAPGDDKKLTVRGEKIEFTTLKEKADKNGKDILDVLEELELGAEGMYFDEMTGYVKMKVDSIEIEGMYLDVYLDKNGEIASLTGVWPKIEKGSSEEKVSVIQAVNSICVQLPKGSHITAIERAYVLSGTDSGFEVKNAWRVYNQGRGYLCYLR